MLPAFSTKASPSASEKLKNKSINRRRDVFARAMNNNINLTWHLNRNPELFRTSYEIDDQL